MIKSNHPASDNFQAASLSWESCRAAFPSDLIPKRRAERRSATATPMNVTLMATSFSLSLNLFCGQLCSSYIDLLSGCSHRHGRSLAESRVKLRFPRLVDAMGNNSISSTCPQCTFDSWRAPNGLDHESALPSASGLFDPQQVRGNAGEGALRAVPAELRSPAYFSSAGLNQAGEFD